MSEIDVDLIKDSIGLAVQNAVGSMLYQETTPDGLEEPAVFIARQDKPYTRYPFVIIDFDGSPEPEGWIQGQLVNDEDKVEYFQTYILSFSIQVFDRGDRSKASTIATRIRSAFNQLSSPARTLRERADVTLENLYPVIDYSSKTKQGYLDVYGFNLTVSATQHLVDDTVTLIAEVNQDIELKRNKEDSNPLIGQVNIDLNSN